MPQCKKASCSVEAVPGAKKRYCPQHLAEYKAKRAAYDRIQATLPDCTCRISPSCSGKISQTGVERGDTMCGSCSAAMKERRRAALVAADKRDIIVASAMGNIGDRFTDEQRADLRGAFTALVADLRK